MRLIRHITPDGKCKYAIVRLDKLRKLPKDSLIAESIIHSLDNLAALGVLEYGEPGSEDEFFVLKLKDKFALRAIDAYNSAVISSALRQTDKSEVASLNEYADDLSKLEDRAAHHPSRKNPD